MTKDTPEPQRKLVALNEDFGIPEGATSRVGFQMRWQEPGQKNVRWLIQPRPDGAWFDLEMPGPMPHPWFRFWQRVLLGWRWKKPEKEAQ